MQFQRRFEAPIGTAPFSSPHHSNPDQYCSGCDVTVHDGLDDGDDDAEERLEGMGSDCSGGNHDPVVGGVRRRRRPVSVGTTRNDGSTPAATSAAAAVRSMPAPRALDGTRGIGTAGRGGGTVRTIPRTEKLEIQRGRQAVRTVVIRLRGGARDRDRPIAGELRCGGGPGGGGIVGRRGAVPVGGWEPRPGRP